MDIEIYKVAKGLVWENQGLEERGLYPDKAQLPLSRIKLADLSGHVPHGHQEEAGASPQSLGGGAIRGFKAWARFFVLYLSCACTHTDFITDSTKHN